MNSTSNCKIPWVRDEVILALAFYYSIENKVFNPLSEDVKRLSKQLQSLPIYFSQTKPDDFRNCNGMHYQLSKLHMVLKGTKELSFIAKIWAETVCYYRNQLDILQLTASAIIKAGEWLSSRGISVVSQETLFAEGCILEYIHSIIEKKRPCQAKNCMICGMYSSSVYSESAEGFLENHLLVEPWNLCPDMKIKEKDVIALCPNCHKVLHRIRPWISDIHDAKILIWENK